MSSLWQMLTRLSREGYDVGGMPATPEALSAAILRQAVNVPASAPGALEKLARSGQAVLVPMAQYRRWFDRQPAALRDSINAAWGPPEAARAMTWTRPDGARYFVLPAMRFGNVIVAAQPYRGWTVDIGRAFTQRSLPPHHQYLAFYLWLQESFKAHAMVHLGAHGTHEWLPGRDAGLADNDASDVLVGAVPQVYPFVVSNLGDALQAKRRGAAAIVSHMLPPFDRNKLNRVLAATLDTIDDWLVAEQQSSSTSAGLLSQLNQQAGKLGLLQDIGRDTLLNRDDVSILRAYLVQVSEQFSPQGLHTFGVPPTVEQAQATAEAILSFGARLPDEAHARQQQLLVSRQVVGAAGELDALLAGLSGRYIQPGPAGSPLRRPQALPTGRNLTSLVDPARLPTISAWHQGQALAERFVADHRQRHGVWPSRTAFVGLWDSVRSDGVTHAQMLALMGVRPVWDERGVVTGIEVVSRRELGRPRVDVVMIPAGRGAAELMSLFDRAVTAVKDLEEPDNAVRSQTARAAAALEAIGVDTADAERMASVRIFTAPPGAFGTGIDNVIPASNAWNDEARIAQVYLDRMGFLYGQGYAGERPVPGGTQVFRLALSGIQAVLHTYSGDSVAVLDHSSAYRHLGGAALAVRHTGTRPPETIVLNVSGPTGQLESLDRFMGREMRARYTNPDWIRAMMKEGHSGAAFVNDVVQRLWGFQVVTPASVGDARWREMYETYVADRDQIGVRGLFRGAGNLLAYQAIVDRMLVAANKGYWKPDAGTLADLNRINREVIAEAGVACDANSCSSAEVIELARRQDQRLLEAAYRMPLPGLRPVQAGPPAGNAPGPVALAPAQGTGIVHGFEIEEKSLARASRLVPPGALIDAAAWIICLMLVGFAGSAVHQRWMRRTPLD
ncbi:MAG: cobaltochelatase subunit CobN [Rhodocyclaceae bacterium]|nr:cobaltochelatase subunit CobN [Rhodocyclaceae bacterium]